MQLRQLPPDPLEEADLEANQVVVDAHPVTGVLPVLGFDVLPLERAPGWPLCLSRRHAHDYTKVPERGCGVQLATRRIVPRTGQSRLARQTVAGAGQPAEGTDLLRGRSWPVADLF